MRDVIAAENFPREHLLEHANDETLFPPDLPVRRSHSSVHGSREGANFLYDVCVGGRKKEALIPQQVRERCTCVLFCCARRRA